MNHLVHGDLVRRIDEYRGGIPTLRLLIADLEAFALDQEWRRREHDAFRKEWGKLEEVYATAIERNPPSMTPIDTRRVRRSLDEIKTLLSGHRAG
jgi:hypothetical protein